MQGYVHAKPPEAAGVLSRLADCVASIGTYCDSRHLQLNTTKTEVVWFGTAANLQKMEVKDRRLPVRGVMVEPVEVVRNLGVYLLRQPADTAATCVEYFTHLFLSSAPSAKSQETNWSRTYSSASIGVCPVAS